MIRSFLVVPVGYIPIPRGMGLARTRPAVLCSFDEGSHPLPGSYMKYTHLKCDVMQGCSGFKFRSTVLQVTLPQLLLDFQGHFRADGNLVVVIS
jgi:hypothetical protein